MQSLMQVFKDQQDCSFKDDQDNSEQTYEAIMMMRVIIICISSIALLINIIVIIRKKQYKFNTIRLFMFVQIFYMISLLSVTPHSESFNLELYMQPPEDKFSKYMECIIQQEIAFKCAIEGFVNLTCYSISYWFAVCITMYIKLVLSNNHKKFMKKNGPRIFLAIVLIIVWYMVPFILTFVPGAPFSFGPTGYKYGNSPRNYLFYSGIVNRSSKQGVGLIIFWMMFLPIVMFIYHIHLLLGNSKSIKKLTQLQQINPRQFFLIKSGKLSFVIFSVQIINVFKMILGFLAGFTGSVILVWIVFVLNVIFDFLALLLIWIYLRFYYREGIELQEKSEVMNRSLVQSFSNLSRSII